MKPILPQEEYVIEVNHVSKDFKIYFDKGYTLKERLLFWHRNRSEMRHVLKDINIKVKKGECVGLIGQNGAGKSTTLKLLSKIIYPNSGEIITRGRVACLIELGAGFHPDMSGRENIYTNASIFGLTKKEIDKRMNDIIAFSELEDFIDNPVRTYSSGMYMRLAFSVAINVDADILLVDEILAVGDAAFQAKCFNKMREIKASGVTIVLVSHSLGQIEQICDRSIWFKDGVIEREGKPFDVHPYYLDYMGSKDTGYQKADENPVDKVEAAEQDKNKAFTGENDEQDGKVDEKENTELRWGSREVVIIKVELLDALGKPQTTFKTGEPTTIKIYYDNPGNIPEAVFGFGIFRTDEIHCYGVNTHIDRYENGKIQLQQRGVVTCNIESNNLIAGEYWLETAINREDDFHYDFWRKCLKFKMHSDIGDEGIARLQHQWNEK